MGFIFTTGVWKNAKLMAKNREDKFYAVTVGMTDHYHRRVADEHWRYFNDRWEMFFKGEWKPLTNNLWEVVAYTEIIDLQPCEYN